MGGSDILKVLEGYWGMIHLEDGSSQAGNVTAVREYHSNGTRHYVAVYDRTREVLQERISHDLPEYTLRMFMMYKGD